MPKLKSYSNEHFVFNTNNKEILFANNKDQKNYIKNRVDRILSKEPETINWIKNFPKDSVFFDVGANIGIYTLYSAVMQQNKVFAFEISLSTMRVTNMHEGVASNIVGEKGDYYHGCTQLPLNFLVERKILPQPDYIKIDVDGYEDKVIEGSMNVFQNAKEILIEIDNKHINYVAMIEALGFKLKSQHKRNEKEFNYIFTNGN